MKTLFKLPFWFLSAAAGVVGAAVILGVSFRGAGAFEFGTPIAFVLIPLVLALPAQRAITGVNRLLVSRKGSPRWTLRLICAPLPEVLKIAGLVMCVVAMARPQLTRRETLVESQGLDILLAIDTSGSMRQEDMATSLGYASRIAVAKGVAKEFVEKRPYDRIGVVVFGAEAFTHVPLTLDHETLQSALDMADIGMAGAGGTAVGTAIAVSAKRMTELPAPERVVILVTDGHSNAGEISPEAAAEAAGTLGIRVYTIGVGGGSFRLGVPGDGVDEPMMKRVAALTNGEYFRATDLASLRKIYERIDELQPSPAKVKEIVDREELFRRALVPGTVLLLFSTLLSATWLRRGP